MSASCHLQRVALYTAGRTETAPPAPPGTPAAVVETCDYCAAAELVWRKCKQICARCGQINRSCADL